MVGKDKVVHTHHRNIGKSLGGVLGGYDDNWCVSTPVLHESLYFLTVLELAMYEVTSAPLSA